MFTTYLRLLAYQIHTHILDPKRIPSILRTARHVLFPTNTFPRHKQPPPTDEEVKEIRAKCARTIRSVIPEFVRKVYFRTQKRNSDELSDGERNELEELKMIDGWLASLEDQYCNKHAVFAIVESMIVRLMPELAEKDVEALFVEKVGINEPQ
jgi:hypothetical protein